MKKLANAIATVALIGTPALAADMAVKAPPPPSAPVVNWSGCYIGANGGVAFGMNSTMTWTDIHPPPDSGATQFDQINFNRSSTAVGIGGGQLGCNWQFSPIYIVGLEGDADWTDVSNTASQHNLTALRPAPCQSSLSRQIIRLILTAGGQVISGSCGSG